MSKPPHKLRGQNPNPVQTQQQGRTNQVSVSAQWQGPLPHPAALEKFDQVVPGSAARIIEMAEKEQGHRMDYERRGLDATIAEARRGQYLGVFVCALAIAGSAYSAHVGAVWAAVALAGVPLLGIVQALVRPRTGNKPN